MDKEYLIRKWLADELTDEELQAFNQLEDHQLNLDIVRFANHFKASEISSVDDFETFRAKMPQKSTPVRKLSWTTQLLRIAGILMIGMVVYYFFSSQNSISIHTTLGEKTTVELPDASTIVINADSEISYNQDNWKDKKRVKLTGEAFFEVVSAGSFEVITRKGVVRVLGTKFNIKQRNDYFEVQCFEGVVRVTAGNNSEELRVGENLRLLNGVLSLGQNAFEAPQWINEISSFQRAPIKEVFEELERQYSIEIVLKNVSETSLFTGGFTHNNLENALKSVTEPLNLQYSLETSTKVIISPGEN